MRRSPTSFIKLIRWRARKTILSPASRSPDTVHKRRATLSGSIRSTLQNVSSPNRCCSSWQLVQRDTQYRSDGFIPAPPSDPERTCAASEGAALPQTTQASCLTKAKCRVRFRRSGLGLPRAVVRGMRGAGMTSTQNQRATFFSLFRRPRKDCDQTSRNRANVTSLPGCRCGVFKSHQSIAHFVLQLREIEWRFLPIRCG